jgi:hypothetical protein
VAPKTEPLAQVLTLLEQYPNESGIIYCAIRRQVDELHAVLRKKGYSVRPYHAGLSEKERTENQERFSRDDIRIIVATIAGSLVTGVDPTSEFLDDLRKGFVTKRARFSPLSLIGDGVVSPILIWIRRLPAGCGAGENRSARLGRKRPFGNGRACRC